MGFLSVLHALHVSLGKKESSHLVCKNKTSHPHLFIICPNRILLKTEIPKERNTVSKVTEKKMTTVITGKPVLREKLGITLQILSIFFKKLHVRVKDIAL